VKVMWYFPIIPHLKRLFRRWVSREKDW
jgi:hypothetical protein